MLSIKVIVTKTASTYHDDFFKKRMFLHLTTKKNFFLIDTFSFIKIDQATLVFSSPKTRKLCWEPARQAQLP